MKITQLLNPNIEEKKIKWNGAPKIGWLRESDTIRLYYGSDKSKAKKIFKEGIFVGSDGYILCAIEPNTAYLHSTMRNLQETISFSSSTNSDRCVYVIDLPRKYLKSIKEADDKIASKKLYETWGKSDVEYYALIDVKLSKIIEPQYIKGFMVK